MDKIHSDYHGEDDLERLVKQAFGVDDDQLLKDFLLAQTEIRDDQIPPEPEDGFARLMEKIEERGVKPRYEVNAEQEEGKEQRPHSKSRRTRSIVRAALAAALAAAMMLAMGITAGAKRSYRYTVTQNDASRNDMVLNNVDAIDGKDLLYTSYDEIYRQTGIVPLKLAYIPPKLKYLKTQIGETRAIMSFSYGEKRFSIYQQARSTGSSANIVSDREDYDTIYNEWLKQDIVIGKALTENKEIEYSAYIVKDDAYYLLSGILEGKEFKKIIEDVYLEK